MDTAWFMIVAVPVLVDFRISRKSSEIDNRISASAPESCHITSEIIVKLITGFANVVASGARAGAPVTGAVAATPAPVKAIRL